MEKFIRYPYLQTYSGHAFYSVILIFLMLRHNFRLKRIFKVLYDSIFTPLALLLKLEEDEKNNDCNLKKNT